MSNILVLSVGTRNKIIQYFKKELQGKGKVIATDMSRLAPALYEADAFYIVPRMTEPGYIEKILEICRTEKIQGVLSLIDPELSLLAENKDRFAEIGTCVIGSDYEVCERSLNKWEMYQWLEEHHYRCAKSYVDKEEFFKDIEKGEAKYPVFVKPVCGSASIAISKVYDRETIELLFQHNEGLMIQEYLEGQEIGADCYIDMISGKLVSIFTKKKLVMRAGETDKAESFIDPKLNELLSSFAEEMGYRGQIDIDVFEKDEKYYISEVNPRFGGGYPHAYECGVNHMKLIVNNLEGKENEKQEPGYDEGVYMMKYNEISILNGGRENEK
ncbi:carbamoyl phosphate synthase [Drancourtella sp. An12]|uniref:ATP-grasp domain-containing protein n=1 Tax=Drancourtella sp. An12 TaxID=1965548 RepID=UPI000B3A9468|nr:ATP-grasp domain-containing protein [Drancourtella sp. An12]OUQ46527.1 carbamoyl phosphate synthase [Drancourtella sp. An12]